MIDEIRALQAPESLVRISPETNVPLTDRVIRLLDTTVMRRLGRISQLGLVNLVYPGATHSRLEHSLGVYRNALLFMQRLVPEFQAGTVAISSAQAEAFVVASLLHDIGHWPFCHLIEDMQLTNITRHEKRAKSLLEREELSTLLRSDWSCTPGDIARLLSGPQALAADDAEPIWCLLASMLSGPIDVDKMDYLVRDSLHSGVPYGRNFDSHRLIGSLAIHPDQRRLVVRDKGRTAAEMMVFARYVMFSEVYWHHAVRSATAMLQQAVFYLSDRVDLKNVEDFDEAQWVAQLCDWATNSPVASLVDGLFGTRRILWKRVAEFNLLEQPALHQKLARRPYWWLVACSERLAECLSARMSVPIAPGDVIIDAPPVDLDVDIDVHVIGPDKRIRTLGDVSPVVDALANRQFDDFVKRVRVFVRPEIRNALPSGRIDELLLHQVIEETEQGLI